MPTKYQGSYVYVCLMYSIDALTAKKRLLYAKRQQQSTVKLRQHILRGYITIQQPLSR